jgi:uncharacterized protein YciI
MHRYSWLFLAAALFFGNAMAPAACAATDTVAAPFDARLAAQTGADEYGMRNYVLVILKTGPKRMPDGAARDAMFAGHMANIRRLSDAGKLVLAGPFGDGSGDWRGLFVFAVRDIDQAKALVATDPVVSSGEMVAEYHKWYGSAAVMQIRDLHARLARKSF